MLYRATCGVFGHFRINSLKITELKSAMPFPFGDLKFTPFGTSHKTRGDLGMVLTFCFGLLKLTNYFFIKWGIFGLPRAAFGGYSLRHSSFFPWGFGSLNEGLGGHEPWQAPSSCDSHIKKRGKNTPFAACGLDL